MQSGVIVVDDEMVMRALARALDAGARPRGLLAAIGRYGVSSTRLRFRNQVDPEGRRWAPSKRVLKHGGQTLRLTGRLRNSVTFNVIDDGVEWGTNVKYAARHQFGFDEVVRVRPHMRVRYRGKEKANGTETGKPHFVRAYSYKGFTPRRAFLGFNAEDRLAVMKIAGDFLREQIDG